MQLDWRMRELDDLRAERRRLQLLEGLLAEAYLRVVEELGGAAPVGEASADNSSPCVKPRAKLRAGWRRKGWLQPRRLGFRTSPGQPEFMILPPRP